jgi:hypothetical protein
MNGWGFGELFETHQKPINPRKKRQTDQKACIKEVYGRKPCGKDGSGPKASLKKGIIP